MAKVLLILPPLPQPMGAPYLGQQYLAANLLALGHQVQCADMASVFLPMTREEIIEFARQWQPDLIGMTLFTSNALKAYQLAHQLRPVCDFIVAGGPHTTVLPKEALEGGFDVAVVGEGEQTLADLVSVRCGQLAITEISGIHYRRNPIDRTGLQTVYGSGPAKAAIEDLDVLPFPLASYSSFNHHQYSNNGSEVVAGGMLTSRGCPPRCTFCANYVTGRSFRWRSAENVIAEMKMLKSRYGVMHFSFWDDAFTARRPRLIELCEAILAEPELRHATWSAITPANMVKPSDLQLMWRAGCRSINFGIESGDLQVLRAIHKGLHPIQVTTAVSCAKSQGMITIVNFMFGFPQEDLQALDNTLALMQSLAPATDIFNHRGVLVPFPGTQIYDDHHERYAFTDWWLDPVRIPNEPNVHRMSTVEQEQYLEQDSTLAIDFFHYPPEIKRKIVDCARFKAQHNSLKRSTLMANTALSDFNPRRTG